jgi:hypothetical protein
MKHKKIGRRQEKLKQTLFFVQHDMVSRKPASDEEIEELFNALDGNNLAKLGLIKLSGMELDHLHPRDNFYEPSATLISYSACLSGRDSSVYALLRSGADPSVRFSKTSSSSSTLSHLSSHLRNYLNRIPSCFAVYIIKKLNEYRHAGVEYVSTDTSALNICESCCNPMDQPVLWEGCRHLTCEACFWKKLSMYSDDDDLSCHICKYLSCHTPPSLQERRMTFPAVTKLESLELFKNMPVDMDVTLAKQTKPKFKARSLQELASLYMGVIQSQRTDLLFKAASTGNCRRLEALIRHGADIDFRNEYGQSVLFAATMAQQTHAMELLIAYGADMYVEDNSGATLATLLCSADTLNGRLLQLLLRNGVSFNSQGSVGLSPRDYMMMRGLGDYFEENLFAELDVESTTSHNPTIFGLPFYDKLVTLENIQVQCLIAPDADHPGAKSFTIDGGFSDTFLGLLEALWSKVPIAPAEKLSCSDRAYYYDVEAWITRAMRLVLQHATKSHADIVTCTGPYPQMRFLHYAYEGGKLPAHVDLSKTDANGVQSTHTFILYVYDCEGGDTALLQSVQIGAQVLASVKPKRGRLLLFPHMCPHEGKPVMKGPKLLIRGEAH